MEAQGSTSGPFCLPAHIAGLLPVSFSHCLNSINSQKSLQKKVIGVR